MDYFGHPLEVIENKHLRVAMMAQAGPRIAGLWLAGRDSNLLAETPAAHWPTPNGEYYLYGGHRLWLAPEIPAMTYIPETGGVTCRAVERGLAADGPIQPQTGLRKTITVQLDDEKPVVRVAHRVTNEGFETRQFAPWAITQLPLGGRMFLPQPVGPFPPENPDAIFAPNRNLVFWPYTRLDDPRLTLADDRIEIDLRGQASAPLKIACFNAHGWASYQREDVLFVKRFLPNPDLAHADRHTNTAAYANELFCELETLGPLVQLPPGQTVEHVEEWQLFQGLPNDLKYQDIVALTERE